MLDEFAPSIRGLQALAQAGEDQADDDLPEIQHRLKTAQAWQGSSVRKAVPCRHSSALLPGDHSNSVPPDPISNSAVKAVCANGTNAQALEE